MLRLCWRLFLLCLLTLATVTAYATPKQIIIIRHGDKLEQAVPGPTLSPKGIERSIAFGIYFENKFGDPDFIVASDPAKDKGTNSSLRELQTIAPLANIVASHHPDKGFTILHPFANYQYAQLASYLLTDAKFNNKQILICWDHTVIPQLAKQLGVTQPLQKWPSKVFDSVYVINYAAQGKVKEFTILQNQYAITNNPTWEELHKKI